MPKKYIVRLTDAERKTLDEIIAKLKGSYDELVNGLKSELQAGQVTITQLKGRLSVNMVDKILFNSGEAEVKPEGPKGFGAVMKVATSRLAGRAEGNQVAAAARKLLGS